MFLDFFLLLRKQHLPVSLKEYLTLLEALDNDVGTFSVEDFYTIAQAALVKTREASRYSSTSVLRTTSGAWSSSATKTCARHP